MFRLISFLRYGNPILQIIYGVLFLAVGVVALVVTVSQARGISEEIPGVLLLLIGLALLWVAISRLIKKGQASGQVSNAPQSQSPIPQGPYQQNP